METGVVAPCRGRRFQEVNQSDRESTVRQRRVWSDLGQSEVCFLPEEVKLIPSSHSLIVDPESISLSCSAAYTKRFTVRYVNYCYPDPSFLV